MPLKYLHSRVALSLTMTERILVFVSFQPHEIAVQTTRDNKLTTMSASRTSKTRHLLRREITYSSAKEKEVNILHQLNYHGQQSCFFAQLDGNRHWLREIVVHHLGLGSASECEVADMRALAPWQLQRLYPGGY